MTKIMDLSSTWQNEQRTTFEFIQLTTKNLHMVVETIAMKEIEKNPIDFMKRESFQVGGNAAEEFYSFNGDDEGVDINFGNNNNMIAEDDSEEDDDEDEDVSDHEYHTEEKTVGKRINPYKQESSVQEESKHNIVVETFSKNEIPSKNNQVKEIEEMFHDSISHQN